jgi:hypothetical protein
MFGIRPLKSIFVIGLLFLIFLVTKKDPSIQAKVEQKESKKLSSYMEELPIKSVNYEDSLKVLHYLFHEKIEDKSVKCKLKKAKTRYFAACKDGDVIKDNYWEVALHQNKLKLLARSQSAVYIINKYHFKELVCDSKKANPKVEKALIKFFK